VKSSVIPVRKRDLEIILQSIPKHPNPKANLEQYTIPADLASEILFQACYTFGDVSEKSVIDLGSGTGRLALGAKMLNAKCVTGVDLDLEAIQSGQVNAKRMGLKINWLLTDISSVHGLFDTVIMNPPFGTKRPHNDVKFLHAALNLGKVIYSIHKSVTMQFLSEWVTRQGASLEKLVETRMPIEHQFPFHMKKRSFVNVQVIRIHH